MIVILCSPSIDSVPGEVYTSLLNVSCATLSVETQNEGAPSSIWKETFVR